MFFLLFFFPFQIFFSLFALDLAVKAYRSWEFVVMDGFILAWLYKLSDILHKFMQVKI